MKGIEEVSYKRATGRDVIEIDNLGSSNGSLDIFVSLKLSPGVFSLISMNDDSEFEIGEYPQPMTQLDAIELLNKCDKTLYGDENVIRRVRNMLSGLRSNRYNVFNHDKLNLTGRKYTFIIRDWNDKLLKKVAPEYEYKGEKYVYFSAYFDYFEWFKVKPLSWEITHPHTDDCLITTTIPIASSFTKYNDKPDGPFLDKYIKSYVFNNIVKTFKLTRVIKYENYNKLLSTLDNDLDIKDYGKIVEVVFEGPSLSLEEKKNISSYFDDECEISYREIELSSEKETSPNDRINEVLDDIYNLLNLGIFSNRDEIIKKIEDLIENYNRDVDDIFKKKDGSLTLSLENLDEKQLYTGLLMNLNKILNDLRLIVNKYRIHIQILNVVNNCLTIIDNKNAKAGSNGLEIDVFKIVNTLLPMLKDNSRLIELKNIFLHEKDILVSYISGDDSSDAHLYENFADFEVNVRKKIEDLLILVGKDVNDMKIISDIDNIFIDLSRGNDIRSKVQYVSFLGNELQKNIHFIRKYGTFEEKEKLDKLLSKEFAGDDSALNDFLLKNVNEEKENVLKSVSTLSILLINVYKLAFDIESRQLEDERRSGYRVSFNRK